MSAFQELFIGLNRIITPLARLFEESENETSYVSIELYRFYQKVINEVFVLIGTCFLDKNSLKGLKKQWEKKLCHNVYTHNNIQKYTRSDQQFNQDITFDHFFLEIFVIFY